MKHTRYKLIRRWLLTLALVLVSVVLLRQTAGGKLQEIERLLQIIFLTLSVSLFLLAIFLTYYVYHGFGSQEGIFRGDPHERLVSISFDDGPNPIYTPQILDILKAKGVKATFFVLGRQVEKYPDIARRIVEEGHDIGNHTYSHRELVPSTRRIVLNQVRKADRAIQKATGVKTRLFRPPRGMYSNALRKILREEGYRIILWTVSTADWSGISAKAILHRIKLYVRRGGTILFHDSGALFRNEGASRENTVQALPMVIDYLQQKGFKIVPISEMLKMSEGLIEEAKEFELFEEV
ncbi:MAG: polysaccharide deacetylase family protein [Actinomycetota bacterium]|nr:polysaccharide deacetylase family protein [Actinomycetota bacterium]